MAKLLANSEDPDQSPHSTVSDLGVHCLPITLLGVSRLQWVNEAYLFGMRTKTFSCTDIWHLMNEANFLC